MDISKLLDEVHGKNMKSDALNANLGSDGTNATYDKVQGNRGKQMNPTWHATQQPSEVQDGDEDMDQGDVYSHDGGD